jgi:hypothetical protein
MASRVRTACQANRGTFHVRRVVILAELMRADRSIRATKETLHEPPDRGTRAPLVNERRYDCRGVANGAVAT